MVDLDFIESWLDERSPPGATGSNLLRASAVPESTKGQKPRTLQRTRGRPSLVEHGVKCGAGKVSRLRTRLPPTFQFRRDESARQRRQKEEVGKLCQSIFSPEVSGR